MKTGIRYLILALILPGVFGFAALFAAADKEDKTNGKFEPDTEYFWAKGEESKKEARAPARPNSSPNMSWHGGSVMKSAVVRAIFWGTSWGSYSGDKITGLASFYTGVNGSNYGQTSGEYYDGSGNVGNTVTFQGSTIDTTAAAGGNSTSAILAEVCKVVTNPVSNGYYPVYVDLKRGNAGYCAWHSASSCGGVPVQFAFFFNLDGDAGCDPQDTSGLHSQGLAALANVSGHEISEARSDPRLNAWYDNSGAENADKCAWSFGTNLVPFTNGSFWKIQGNWSNAAYNSSNRGYANRNGQKGCLDGGNFN